MRFLIRTLLLFSVTVAPAFAAEPVTGPVIDNYGPVFAVPEGSFNLDPDQDYKIIMDIGKGPEDPAAVNRSIESAARFLNLHARNGINAEQLSIAVVLHGSAGRAALTDQAHTEHFDVANGSRALLEELSQAGVNIEAFLQYLRTDRSHRRCF